MLHIYCRQNKVEILTSKSKSTNVVAHPTSHPVEWLYIPYTQEVNASGVTTGWKKVLGDTDFVDLKM